MTSLESPHKKMKMTTDSDDLVRVHLDHHIGSSLLKQKIPSNPFVLKSLVKVGSLIDTRLQTAGLIGFCEKYGLIFSNKKTIWFVKNGEVTRELKNLYASRSACVELGTENDYVIFIEYGQLRKVDLDGNCIGLKEHQTSFSNVVFDATRNRIIVNDNYELYLIEPETGEIVHSFDCPSVNSLCVGHDGQLFVLYDSKTIMALYGENYSQSRTLATLDGPLNEILMHTWDDRLVVNKRLKNNVQEIIHVDTKTGKIQEFATFRDFSPYHPMGKYLLRNGDNEISIFDDRVQIEHFDCIWSKEVHSLMKKLNIEIPQKCSSIMYNDVALPTSIVWFLNVNWSITNCLEYCGEFHEGMNSEDAIEFAQTFCFNHNRYLDIPNCMDEWMKNNNDGIILGMSPTESMRRADCFIATKTSECIGEEFPLYLIKRNHGIETCSLLEFLSKSKPILATLITVDNCVGVACEHDYEDAYERGVFEFDYLTCIQELKDKNIICDGTFDTKSLLSAYQELKSSSHHKLSTIPEEILEDTIEFEGHKYPCRDLIVLAFKFASSTTNFYEEEN